MASPGFDPNQVRVLHIPSNRAPMSTQQPHGQGFQRPSGGFQRPSGHRFQNGPNGPAQGASIARARRSANRPPTFADYMRPIAFILAANVLLIVAFFLILTIFFAPVGLVSGWQAFRIGTRGIRDLMSR